MPVRNGEAHADAGASADLVVNADGSSSAAALSSVGSSPESLLGARLALSPRVALRPEPFGALAYHFDTRRLSFLRHPDVVTVVEALGGYDSVDDCLVAVGIDRRRWRSFDRALRTLLDSEMLVER